MSQRTHGIEFHRLKGVKRQSGRFQTNGINNPSVIVGSGFTVVRTGVGVFRVTFDGPYKTNLCTLASVGPGAAPNAVQVAATAIGPTVPAQITLSYFEQDAVTKDFAAADAAATWVNFSVDFLDIGAQLWPRG